MPGVVVDENSSSNDDLDVDTDFGECTSDDDAWGFKITGGTQFAMPITIFYVSEGGQANQAGLKLGDTVTKINQVETKNMSLTKATKSIQLSDNELKLSVKSFEEDEKSSVQEREVVLKASASKSTGSEKKVENREDWIPQPERKVWHPVVWQQPPPPIPPEQTGSGEDAPHKRIIRNIHRFFKETENNPEARKNLPCIRSHYLPLSDTLEAQLRAMQIKLSQIAMIPILIQSTLETVSKTVDSVTTETSEELSSGESENHSAVDRLEDFEAMTHDIKEATTEQQPAVQEESKSNEEAATTDNGDNADNVDQQKSTDDDGTEFSAPQMPELMDESVISEQQLKMREMDKSWPWKDEEKKVYRRSNFSVATGKNMIQNRIKQLNEGQVMAFYNRKTIE